MMQEQALAILKTGQNVFLTGEPGAGKSYTVNAFVEHLQNCGLYPAITASTGIAATHISGMTIHSWSGIGISKWLPKEEIERIANSKRVSDHLNGAHTLIIDEISMLDGRMLDLVNAICKAGRSNPAPFGGMQVVFVGDFFQLPPVSRAGEPEAQFAFHSQAWQEANPTICYLSEQHRQDDMAFLDVLSAFRRNVITDDHKRLLIERRAQPDFFQTGTHITKLYSHNADVDKMNDQQLRKISDAERRFEMRANGSKPLTDQLKRGCLSPEVLVLKTGALVMFTKNNFQDGYANGTTGTISGFSREGFPLVRMKNGKTVEVQPAEWKIESDGRLRAVITQIPLRLAWAMTVHKSQGMSLDAAYIDLSSAFAYGQGYVALSRVRSLQGLHLGGLNMRALEVDPRVLDADYIFRDYSLSAEEICSMMDEAELKESHNSFITRCGGKVGFKKVTIKLKPKKEKKEPTFITTLKMIEAGKRIAEVAEERGLTEGTVMRHLEDAKIRELFLPGKCMHIAPKKKDFEKMRKAFEKLDTDALRPVFDELKEVYSYDDLRLARLFL